MIPPMFKMSAIYNPSGVQFVCKTNGVDYTISFGQYMAGSSVLVKLQDEDALVSIRPIRDVQDVVLMTENGFVLRFPAEEVSEKKKGAVGVRGMKLQKNDSVEEVYLFEEGTESKVIFHEKEVTLNRLKRAKRDGTGTRMRK